MSNTVLTTVASRLLYRHSRLLNPHRPHLHGIQKAQSLSTETRSEERRAKRQAEVAARRERRKAAKQQDSDLNAYHATFDKPSPKVDSRDAIAKEQQQEEKQKMFQNERDALLLEAGALSRSLYRTCLRCVKIMRQGNEHDEEEFREREENQLKSMKEAIASGNFSMSPPVDRENELSSRALYYHGHTREHFEGESDCLKHNPWIEQQVDRYLYYLRSGEDKRKWVMKDYKFADPFENRFDNERVDQWEARARKLLKETYDTNDWILPSELRSKEWPKTKWDDDDDV